MGCCCTFMNGADSIDRRNPFLRKNSKADAKTKFAKVVLLGDKSVGKSSIVIRLEKNTFYEIYSMTMGAAYFKYDLNLKNEVQFTLNIWDTAGEERFRNMLPTYYENASAAVLVYDATNIKSFESLQYWLNELDSKTKNEGMIIALAGNKSDLPDNQKQVSFTKAKTFAENHKLIFFETSAKTGEGISPLFQKLGEKIYKKKKKK